MTFYLRIAAFALAAAISSAAVAVDPEWMKSVGEALGKSGSAMPGGIYRVGLPRSAIHNHMLNDQPRLFFMHFWANDDVNKLANGLKAALAKVNVANHG